MKCWAPIEIINHGYGINYSITLQGHAENTIIQDNLFYPTDLEPTIGSQSHT